MALAYTPPGVSVTEVNNATVGPFSIDPTSICIVGPGRGYQENTELFVLDDNVPVTLALDGVTGNPVVIDASDPNSTPFAPDTDFIFDAATSQLRRAMQTQINSGEQVVIYYTDGTNAWTEFATLVGLNDYAPVNRRVQVTRDNVHVQREGQFSPGEFVITPGTGSSPHSINVSNSANVLRSKQAVYVYFTNVDGNPGYSAVTLNGTTPVIIPNSGGSNTGTIVLRNAVTDSQNTVFEYTRADNVGLTNNDYAFKGLNGTGGTATIESATIARSAGSTTIGAGSNSLQVKVSYVAIPTDYYFPRRFFSLGDVESKHGEAFDITGDVLSPVTFAASIAFDNGAPSVVVQGLFSLQSNGIKTAGGMTNDTSATLADWRNTIESLRNLEDVNVLVPIVSSSSGSTTDALTLSIFQLFNQHMNYMANQDQYMITLCGEDGTAAGNIADKTILRSHAQVLNATPTAEQFVLVSPSVFQFSNPITGALTDFGGQYVAAALAGQLGGRAINESLTHKGLTSVLNVKDFRSEMDKNADASAGLLVVESKRGTIRVRHAITTAVNRAATRELNVIRAKHYIIESVKGQLEDQIIGNVYAQSDETEFIVQLTAGDALERLQAEGALVEYDSIQTNQSTSDPTIVELRFSYLPAYALNYISIKFSVNTTTATVTDTATGA